VVSLAQLRVADVSKSFRGLRAVNAVSFEVESGGIVGLIGPNGAGKTTLFNLIAGALTPDSGTIHVDAIRISGLRADQVCAVGIGRTFQLTRPFGGLSVLDNVMIGALAREQSVVKARSQAQALLARLGLEDKSAISAATLTLPDRKRLEVARALATRPRLLLLDEVMAGLRPVEVEQMIDIFRELNRSDGLGILLIEHVMRAVMTLAQHVVVLHHGEVIARGEPAAVVRDRAVLACYLGEEGAA
jgi:branched-chain amino acid transport system ATP-binding protein